ncbi:hypothetical protein Ciccas_001373 [Cichlidogyrus casuarinus]|uniref:proline--tRNA ligase n=1 Tax=Cichlidogyrus casuarinus TaxID=1844966 RepID=A0ABD2QK67_9PLAT
MWAKENGESKFPNVERYFNHISNLPFLAEISKLLIKSPNEDTVDAPVKTTSSEMKFEEGGKFGDLPGAEMGKVCVRFPPEASGFMHIGHAKAALLNAHYRDLWKGKLILRFDDTNPEKEKEDYEEAILRDLPSIGFHHDHFSHTSDHFDLLLAECQRLIEMGKAYVDDTEIETMREQREARVESKCRNQPLTENLRRWKDMIKGSPEGLKCCVRAKIDMTSDNGAMRDPTIYLYPTYDFACPIVDSIEGVTHALRTSEYNDRNDQYYWFCDSLNLRKPKVIDYSRLALQNTVLSKRKLTWFVENSIVTGWDDARMPTVRGILRHGMTAEGLRQFILAQGSSRSVAYMEWDKIWAFNKKIIENSSKRYTGLTICAGGLVPVRVLDQKSLEKKMVPNHPKDNSMGEREIWLAPQVLVEQVDANSFEENKNVTFINWGNLIISKINRQGDKVVSVEAKLNLSDTDFKKTLKINWLADPAKLDASMKQKLELVPVSCITYDNIISKGVLSKEDDFKDYVNRDTKHDECLLGDPLLRDLKKGDIVQLMRKGFYICDAPYSRKSPATGGESPLVLILIPDGTTKSISSAVKSEEKTSVTSSSKKSMSAPNTDNMTPEQKAKAREKEDKKAARKAAKAVATGKSPQTPSLPTGDSLVQDLPSSTPPKSEQKNMPSAKSVKKDKSSTPKQDQACAQGKVEKVDKKPAPKKEEADSHAAAKAKKQTKLGMEASKTENTSDWYQQIITKAEMLEYYDVSGCYILRPWSYYVWNGIQAYIDMVIERLGVENCYFPMFVSKAALEKEKEHIADFAPEVAWVTKAGSSEMAEPVAIRPTSETIMYPAFAKWVQSHRDLPIKVNQWSNVVRWEFKQPSPFLRTREFLWQEGHTAYANKADADEEVLRILDLYASVYTDLLAVPVVKGRKTENEKFPGGEYTTTVEAYISASGRGIQGATSHHLGQNFSKMFEVEFEDPETMQKQYAFQNSWGMTTRTIGVMILVHSDDKGLVMPPRVCRYQVVVVPCGITAKTAQKDKDMLTSKCREVAKKLSEIELSQEVAQCCPTRRFVRVHLDDRDNVSPGFKFNHWELKGVPVRVEIGPKDLANNQVTAVLRFDGSKLSVNIDQLEVEMPKLLDKIHHGMLNKAQQELDANIYPAKSIGDLIKALDKRGLAVLPFCGDPNCEDKIKEDSAKGVIQEPGKPIMGAKSLCQPFPGQFKSNNLKAGPCKSGEKCAQCGKNAISFTLFGRSY